MENIVVGIDIGGTNTVFSCVDVNGKSYCNGSIPTQTQERFEDYISDLCGEIELAIENVSEDLKVIGVGIGAPSGNFHTGAIENAANLRWEGLLEVTCLVKERMNVPVKLTNDANAAALGERTFGGAKNMSDYIVITLGTGLGSGIIVNGDLLYGHDGFAAEVGHIIVRPEGRECGCGRRGCLETYVSATGVKRTAYKFLAKNLAPSVLRDITFNELTAKKVSEAAMQGDPIAKDIFTYTGKMLGEALANVAAVTSPKAIFFFGGLAKAGELLFEPVRKSMEENILFLYKDKISLLPSELGDDAAVLGAAALIWNDQLPS